MICTKFRMLINNDGYVTKPGLAFEYNMSDKVPLELSFESYEQASWDPRGFLTALRTFL
jgi:hypothetical protein